MSIFGWYYLHTNGGLIFRRDLEGAAADLRESDFVRAFWPLDTSNREAAWTILVEASALGARPDRIKELAEKWQCDNADAAIYAKHVGAELEMDGAAWCAHGKNFVNLQESAAGFGDSALAALAALAKEIGYHGGKMWGHTFASLLSTKENAK